MPTADDVFDQLDRALAAAVRHKWGGRLTLADAYRVPPGKGGVFFDETGRRRGRTSVYFWVYRDGRDHGVEVSAPGAVDPAEGERLEALFAAKYGGDA